MSTMDELRYAYECCITINITIDVVVVVVIIINMQSSQGLRPT